jgi:hypothetical protein
MFREPSKVEVVPVNELGGHESILPSPVRFVAVPSFEDFFHSESPARDKFLSRLFGLFSEDVVRHWCGCPEAPYGDLGRPFLRAVGEADRVAAARVGDRFISKPKTARGIA